MRRDARCPFCRTAALSLAAALGIACQKTPDAVPKAAAPDAAIVQSEDVAISDTIEIDASVLADAVESGQTDAIAETIADAVADVRAKAKSEPFPDAPNGPVYGAPPLEGGPRTTSEYESVIGAKRVSMKRCAEKVDGGTHGKTKISLEIAPDGSVTKATAEPGELAAEAVACILAIARGMKFSKANDVARIVFPVVIAEQ